MSFEPKDGVSMWRTIYERLTAAKVDDVVTYEELGALIDGDKSAVQSAVRRAARELETVDKHSLLAVPNIGYRVVTPEEHLTLAKAHQRKSSRSLARGYSTTVNVDMRDMEPEVQKAFGVVAQAFSMQMEFNRRFDIRQQKLENQIEAMNPKIERNETELAELRARLEMLEGNTQ